MIRSFPDKNRLKPETGLTNKRLLYPPVSMTTLSDSICTSLKGHITAHDNNGLRYYIQTILILRINNNAELFLGCLSSNVPRYLRLVRNLYTFSSLCTGFVLVDKRGGKPVWRRLLLHVDILDLIHLARHSTHDCGCVWPHR